LFDEAFGIEVVGIDRKLKELQAVKNEPLFDQLFSLIKSNELVEELAILVGVNLNLLIGDGANQDILDVVNQLAPHKVPQSVLGREDVEHGSLLSNFELPLNVLESNCLGVDLVQRLKLPFYLTAEFEICQLLQSLLLHLTKG